MATKLVIVWAKPSEPAKKYIPVDEQYYADNEADAKLLARDLLPAMRDADMGPVEILEISEEKFNAMLEGTTPLLTFNQDSPRETEMLELGA